MTELTADLLLRAYSVGVFPMAEHQDDPEVFWVDPKLRGILPLDGFRISRSLAKRLKRGAFQITIDQDFPAVVRACADRAETWINDDIYNRYVELHQLGHAHSVEVWQDGELSGGVYGVTLGGAFFGESMFSRRTDASKIALCFLIDRLRQAGFTLCDTQFITPHLASMGGVEISRDDYQARLKDALLVTSDFTAPAIPTAQEMLQRRTQTS
ncbi:leucyl/phenylalanyl-tRNA--protein transferase [Sedimentitalea sp. CY04]|uniref:Leucyl/phenylalanyl-tRNA--protein transferase n=1 Tax=Parasedimentitalea denitrificans TaxID=2211118 RepID=A0ABX0W2Q6_9RHOB|nr:leucyl/phenylalanyl-tRNA--protein transferase [Sedimentitalea sp. CY04]NIZ59921.1 leucyl/phenylalanyl-tRNA--protein transferase [Sedimentitalea sp. CY04]